MSRSRFLFPSLLLAAAAALIGYAHVGVSTARDIAVSAADWLTVRIARVAAVAPEAIRTETREPNRTPLLVAANAFVDRLVKRERPHVTAQWRMCPSI